MGEFFSVSNRSGSSPPSPQLNLPPILDLGRDATLDSLGGHKLRSGPGVEDHMYSP